MSRGRSSGSLDPVPILLQSSAMYDPSRALRKLPYRSAIVADQAATGR